MNEPSLQTMVSDPGQDAPLFSAKVLYSGLSFTLFGLTGLTLSLTVFPLLYLLPVAAPRRKRLARRILSSIYPGYIRFMELCGLIRIRPLHSDCLREGGQLVIANHPSLLDAVYLLAMTSNATCLVKRSLFFNPFTAGPVRAAGYIRNDSDTLLQDCTDALAAGDNLIIFPEGTRTDPETPFRFLRGPANIALAAQCDIRPVVIRCRPARLMKHQAWYQMSTETLDVNIQAFPSIAIAPYLANETYRSRTARKLTADLENFYRCR